MGKSRLRCAFISVVVVVILLWGFWLLTRSEEVWLEVDLPEEAGRIVVTIQPANVPMRLVHIPGGHFIMGSTDPIWSEPNQRPAHRVSIDYDFYMLKTEVTQGQWYSVMGTRPWEEVYLETIAYSDKPTRHPVKKNYFNGIGEDYPAYGVSWDDCVRFIDRLNELAAQLPTENELRFRLPSEAEWEYACRAGSATRFYYGDSDCELVDYDFPALNIVKSMSCDLDDYAVWGASRHRFGPDEVGGKIPNAWGLFDMHGNLMEPCQDNYHESYHGAPVDGRPWQDNQHAPRVYRGGCWIDFAKGCTSTARCPLEQDIRGGCWGLRLVMETHRRGG